MKMRTVTIEDVTIGTGRPKLIVPLVGTTQTDLIKEAEFVSQLPCDIVEWRIDFYEKVLDFSAVSLFSQTIKTIINKPLLITFRSKKEGGERELSTEKYFQLYQEIIRTGTCDLVDIELFMPEKEVSETIELAHKNGIKVIMCNHEFHHTPPMEEILSRLKKMQDKKADICKIAVMPNTPSDVLTLLAATEIMTRKYATRPIITMSMGALGMISRISGELTGSSATFGAAMKASAPGQIPVGELKKMIETLEFS